MLNSPHQETKELLVPPVDPVAEVVVEEVDIPQEIMHQEKETPQIMKVLLVPPEVETHSEEAVVVIVVDHQAHLIIRIALKIIIIMKITTALLVLDDLMEEDAVVADPLALLKIITEFHRPLLCSLLTFLINLTTMSSLTCFLRPQKLMLQRIIMVAAKDLASSNSPMKTIRKLPSILQRSCKCRVEILL
jgi:hypothetical protein